MRLAVIAGLLSSVGLVLASVSAGMINVASDLGPPVTVDPAQTTGAFDQVDEATETLKAQVAARDAWIAKLEQDKANILSLAAVIAEECTRLPAGPQICGLATTVEWPARTRELAQEAKFSRVHVIYQADIDPEDDAVLNADLLEAKILKVIPEDFAGEAVLDWEGKAYDLARGPPSPESDAARAQMIAALDLADSLRPAASWSMYAIPPRWMPGPGGIADPWEAWITNLMPVIDRCESLTVSLYRFYRDDLHGGEQAKWNAGTAFITLDRARELAGDRQVLVFFMDVYHDGGTQPYRGDPIHVVEMQQAVRVFAHCGADVVVWWRQQKDVTGFLAEYIIRSWAEAVALNETGPPR